MADRLNPVADEAPEVVRDRHNRNLEELPALAQSMIVNYLNFRSRVRLAGATQTMRQYALDVDTHNEHARIEGLGDILTFRLADHQIFSFSRIRNGAALHRPFRPDRRFARDDYLELASSSIQRILGTNERSILEQLEVDFKNVPRSQQFYAFFDQNQLRVETLFIHAFETMNVFCALRALHPGTLQTMIVEFPRGPEHSLAPLNGTPQWRQLRNFTTVRGRVDSISLLMLTNMANVDVVCDAESLDLLVLTERLLHSQLLNIFTIRPHRERIRVFETATAIGIVGVSRDAITAERLRPMTDGVHELLITVEREMLQFMRLRRQ